MVLEYSGRYLALIEWAAAMKLVVFLSLIANVFAPWGIATTLAPAAIGIGLVVYILKIAGLAVLIGILESMIAKLRLFRVPELLGAAFILALLGLVFFYVLRG
jgi:formate hydrogenlyase subunit 4